MASSKPQPLVVDGKAYYTLSSYDPVEVEVYVASVTDDDVDYAIEQLLDQRDATMADLDDPEFVSKQFEGCKTADDVRAEVRRQLEEANDSFADEHKLSLVAEELASRLVQAVPADQLDRVRNGIELQLRDQLQRQGVTWGTFLQQSGGADAVDKMLREQAVAVAEQDSALAAWAQKKALKVDRSEIPGLLGIPLEHASEFLDQVEAAGQMDDFMEGALRAKALNDVVATSVCTYHHETPEEAKQRVAIFRAQNQRQKPPAGNATAPGKADDEASASEPQDGDGSDKPHLKLV